MREGWDYVELSEAIEKGSSNISLKKIADDGGEFPVFGAKGFAKNISYFQQEKEYIAIIKDGAGIGRISKHPAKSSILATMQYLIPREGFDIDFVRYFLLGMDFGKFRVGSTIPHIYWKHYKTEKIPALPLAEQKRIVGLLDEAFAGIAGAAAAARKNLANARELFETALNATFTQKGEGWLETTLGELVQIRHGFAFKSAYFSNSGDYVLLTPGNFYEAGGYRDRKEKQKYYAGEIPDGYLLEKGNFLIAMTEQAVGLLGSSMIVPENGVFLHNQRLGLVRVNEETIWNNEFFLFSFSSKSFRDRVQSSASGLKVRHTSPKKLYGIPISYPPDAKVQAEIANKLSALSTQTQRLEALYQHKLDALDELKQSLLQKAFAGELTSETKAGNVIAFPSTSRAPEPVDTNSPAFSANVLAVAYARHASQQRDKTFGRVKAQKTLHLVESIGGIELGRQPIKDAAGPNDSAHMRSAENWAKEQQFFEFVKKPVGRGYDFKKLPCYDEMKAKALAMLKPYRGRLEKVTRLLINKDTEQAAVFATVHAAWNNLILDGIDPTDDAIIFEARENWHADKLNIDKSKFKTAIAEIKRRMIIPDGCTKYVGRRQESFL